MKDFFSGFWNFLKSVPSGYRGAAAIILSVGLVAWLSGGISVNIGGAKDKMMMEAAADGDWDYGDDDSAAFAPEYDMMEDVYDDESQETPTK